MIYLYKKGTYDNFKALCNFEIIEAKNICNNEGLPRSIYEDDGGDSDHFLRSFNGIFENVFGHGAERIEAAITNALGTTSVDDYLRESSGFFADHLQRYTKSRREAPIYWPISTSSGRYTLWLYYPSLTDQTLFTAINDFIEPKLRQVGQDVAFLRKKDSARSAVDEKILEKLQALEAELIEPSLYFNMDEESPKRFANAFAERMKKIMP